MISARMLTAKERINDDFSPLKNNNRIIQKQSVDLQSRSFEFSLRRVNCSLSGLKDNRDKGSMPKIAFNIKRIYMNQLISTSANIIKKPQVFGDFRRNSS